MRKTASTTSSPETGLDRRGFTLIELLVVIGIFSLLVLGISYVYRSFSAVVGATHSLSGAARDSRGAHGMLYNDLKQALTENDPYFLIFSERRSAFLRNQDLADDGDKVADTVDVDLDGQFTAPGEDLLKEPTVRNYRNCRTDVLGFFIRDTQYKQTGSGNQLVSPMGGSDAFVWYGHLELADSRGNGNYFGPGDGNTVDNTNNYFSSDWILGRKMFLLTDYLTDRTGVKQVAIDRAGAGPLLLSYDSTATEEPSALKSIQSSRNDVVKTSVYDLRRELQEIVANDADADWWSSLVYRFRAIPVPHKPLSGEGIALSAPVFLPRCRQFLVEYAGDYVTQLTDVRGVNGPDTPPDGKITVHDYNDPRYGQVTAAVPDGRVDFYSVETGATVTIPGSRVETVNERIEKVRFYGLPRDHDGTGRIPGYAGGRVNNDLTAVVPLRDVVRTGAAYDAALANYEGAPFERRLPPAATDYAARGGMAPDAAYVCVWGPGDARPMILRIVVTLEDPNGRSIGQTHEYVLQVNR